MFRILIAAGLVAGTPAVAAHAHDYSVSNHAGRAFTCGLRPEGRSAIERFVLRPGSEWRQTAAMAGTRTLYCDSYKVTQRWRMRSGVPYQLMEDRRTGRIVLRTAGPR